MILAQYGPNTLRCKGEIPNEFTKKLRSLPHKTLLEE